MKIKDGYILSSIGNKCIAVAVGEMSEEFSGMIQLNPAGEYLWKELEQGISEDELVAKMLERYTGLDEQTARTDLREFLDTIKIAVEE